ncbi:hypothetical protein E2P86_01905 [Sphingobacterium psychroaquaticum]|uniref:hypothetical protein n=1 Tax=Sphingobacterium psychroaquaticum TaxID=561061 RepID=UPI00106B25DD|nr:hypothetical protein [Sphingobacterium psychroaquaticum]QBQ39970.1 hypothetical protein E2P86_01905 [Sphingobacterium psychroaquaticum]
MKNNILINYPKANSSPVMVDYRVSNEGKLKTISCAVSNAQILPSWLEMQKFELVALKEEDGYSLLFHEKKFDKNLDTVLFIDQVFERIMEARNQPIN